LSFGYYTIYAGGTTQCLKGQSRIPRIVERQNVSITHGQQRPILREAYGTNAQISVACLCQAAPHRTTPIDAFRVCQAPNLNYVVLASGSTSQIVNLELIGEGNGLEATLVR